MGPIVLLGGHRCSHSRTSVGHVRGACVHIGHALAEGHGVGVSPSRGGRMPTGPGRVRSTRPGGSAGRSDIRVSAEEGVGFWVWGLGEQSRARHSVARHTARDAAPQQAPCPLTRGCSLD